MAKDSVSVAIDSELRLFHFRFDGVVKGCDIIAATADAYAYAQVEDLAGFDHVYDLRRFINIITHEDLARLAHLWREGSGRSGATTRFALITTDPLRVARARAYNLAYPDIVADAFPTMVDAVNWLRPSVPATGGMHAQAAADETRINRRRM